MITMLAACEKQQAVSTTTLQVIVLFFKLRGKPLFVLAIEAIVNGRPGLLRLPHVVEIFRKILPRVTRKQFVSSHHEKVVTKYVKCPNAANDKHAQRGHRPESRYILQFTKRTQ